MSLCAFALRLATVMTLRNATAARGNVLDAPMDPISRAVALSGPVIAVYTSDQSFTPKGKSLTSGGTRDIDLRLQIFLPAEVAITFQGGSVSIDVREEGGATLLDAIYRQVERALMVSASAWRELWAELVLTIKEVKCEDLVIPVERGVDLVAREIAIVCRAISGPEIGRTAHVTWPRLIELMRADVDLSPIADWIEEEITASGDFDGDRLILALAGYSKLQGAALGFGPIQGIDPPSIMIEAEAETEPPRTVVRPMAGGAL